MIPIPSAQLTKNQQQQQTPNEIALMLICTIKPTRAKTIQEKRNACTTSHVLFYYRFHAIPMLNFAIQFFLLLFSLSHLARFVFIVASVIAFVFHLKKRRKKRCQQKFHQFQSWVTSMRFLAVERNFSSSKIFMRNNFTICIRSQSQQLLNFALCFLNSLPSFLSLSHSQTALHCNPLSKLCQTLCVHTENGV